MLKRNKERVLNETQEREEREEIEKELRAQNEAFMAAAAAAAAAGGSPPLSHLAGLNIPGLMSATDSNGNSGSTTNKEPPPLGLAGLEAFRREYLTSPLSHLRCQFYKTFFLRHCR